jgi:hypothetical protein
MEQSEPFKNSIPKLTALSPKDADMLVYMSWVPLTCENSLWKGQAGEERQVPPLN